MKRAVALLAAGVVLAACSEGTTEPEVEFQVIEETDFAPRNGLDAPALRQLFAWEEDEFLRRTEGSPIRRIGFDCWLRNIAVALGNAPASAENIAALQVRAEHPSALVREHVQWALERLSRKPGGE